MNDMGERTEPVAKALPSGYLLKEYRIQKVLGTGAFGITYLCQDKHLQTPVAIKEFFPDEFVVRQASNQVAVASMEHMELFEWGLERFISEAQILAQFKHPSIVRVSRYFQENNTAYIVMDYEQGLSLGDFVGQSPSAPGESVLMKVLVALLEGLRIVHEKKYLHRDIKPSNIIIREDGSPVLLDFGAAQLEFRTSSADGVILLTPGYAPCEQYDSAKAQGPYSDLYSLGATLYRCLAGHTPVSSVKRLTTIQGGAQDPLISAAEVGKGRYSTAFLETIDWLLKPLPEERPPTASQVLARLRGQAGNEVTRTSFVYHQKRAVRNYKILFAGPVGVGKTTAIGALSDIPVVNTDTSASDMTRLRKSATTVAMDYGVMRLSDSERLHLYGTPGQERFDFMWDILAKGSLGLVLLIDNSRKDPLKLLDFYLRAFQESIKNTNIVIGVNFLRDDQQHSIEDYYRYLQQRTQGPPMNPPVFEIDARSRRDVTLLVQALLYSIDPGVTDYNV